MCTFVTERLWHAAETGAWSVPLTPVLDMLIALGAAGSMQPIDSSPVTGAQSALSIPDNIAAAVMPYAACLYAVRGLPFLLGRDGRQVRYQKSGGNCSAERRRAQADAEAMLRNRPVPGGGTPTAYVEQQLSQIDDFVARLPVKQSSATPRKTPLIGVPFTLEDEVKPAYDRYEECLKTQVSFSRVTVETILPVFRQATAACWSVRASAVLEAENALVKKGWNASERAKAAENTFATADESWMEMGRQFRDSVIRRMRQPRGHP